MERRAAAGVQEAGSRGESTADRDRAQPVRLGVDRSARLSGHKCVYTIAAVTDAFGPADREPEEETSRMNVYERTTLSNGLRVLTAPLPHAQSVACYIMLAAGSRYEDASNRGIAHFAEHMFFKGTERRPSSRDLTTIVDGMGGEFNAFTSKEYTGYYIRCAGAERDTALDVLVDMIRNSKFDGEELEREKGVILEEMNMYFDTPRDYVSSVYEDLLFGDNPLGWETLGKRETIQAASRETFLRYLEQWYTPPRMVVGVAGMVGDDLIPRLEELVGDMSGNGAGAPAPAEVTRSTEPLVRLHTKDSDQAQICIGVPSYPLTHPDRYALQLLGTVLGTGMSSRLFLEVRERRGLAYYVYGLNSAYTDAGTLYAQGGVDIQRVDEAVSVIAEEFRKMATELVPSDELEKARALAKGRFVLQTESPNGILLFGLRREVLEGRAAEPAELLAGLDAVTAEDVQRVAQDVIASQGMRLAVIGPFDDPGRFETLLA
jgi:predicted Zn-dependent peptidase